MLTIKDRKKRWFITGGAGFIGSHVVDMLMAEKVKQVTVYDNLSLSNDRWLKPYVGKKNFKFIKADILKTDRLTQAIKGHDIVWHLAANTDIPGGFKGTDKDIKNCTLGTFSVLEAMRRNGLSELIFASTGAVYGESVKWPAAENSGPLVPVSLYGAGKISSEAFIAAFSSMFGIKAWVYRFGNVIGDRMTHGVIYDFIKKLKANPKELIILGSGKQRKNYFLVEECINGMMFGYHRLKENYNLVNLGATSTTQVTQIAKIIISEMKLKGTKITIEGSTRAWPGDQPKVLMNVKRINSFGWKTSNTSDQAVRIATQRYLGEQL